MLGGNYNNIQKPTQELTTDAQQKKAIRQIVQDGFAETEQSATLQNLQAQITALQGTTNLLRNQIYESRAVLHHIMTICQDPIAEYVCLVAGTNQFDQTNLNNNRFVAAGTHWSNYTDLSSGFFNSDNLGIKNAYQLSANDIKLIIHNNSVQTGNNRLNNIPQICVDITGLKDKINSATGGVLDEFFLSDGYDPQNPSTARPNSDFFQWSISFEYSTGLFANSDGAIQMIPVYQRTPLLTATDISTQTSNNLYNGVTPGSDLEGYVSNQKQKNIKTLKTGFWYSDNYRVETSRQNLSDLQGGKVAMYFGLLQWASSSYQIDDFYDVLHIQINIHPNGSLSNFDSIFQ